jgi:hypothetical protein
LQRWVGKQGEEGHATVPGRIPSMHSACQLFSASGRRFCREKVATPRRNLSPGLRGAGALAPHVTLCVTRLTKIVTRLGPSRVAKR